MYDIYQLCPESLSDLQHHGLRYMHVDPGLRARVYLLTGLDLEAPSDESSLNLSITMLLYMEAYRVALPH